MQQNRMNDSRVPVSGCPTTNIYSYWPQGQTAESTDRQTGINTNDSQLERSVPNSKIFQSITHCVVMCMCTGTGNTCACRKLAAAVVVTVICQPTAHHEWTSTDGLALERLHYIT